MDLSVLIATRNLTEAEEVLVSLRFENITNEVLIGISNKKDSEVSTNGQIRIIFQNKTTIGIRKQELIKGARGEWILLLDSDEFPSEELMKEISTAVRTVGDVRGYSIAYQNYVFGKPVHYGGEKYSKVRLFQKKYGFVSPKMIHEEVTVRGKIGKISGQIHHYSYKGPVQILKKFSTYASQMAREKFLKNENVTARKLFLYGPHMFWSRYVADEGWRDGWRGFVLALGFGYMESTTYWLLLCFRLGICWT